MSQLDKPIPRKLWDLINEIEKVPEFYKRKMIYELVIGFLEGQKEKT